MQGRSEFQLQWALLDHNPVCNVWKYIYLYYINLYIHINLQQLLSKYRMDT